MIARPAHGGYPGEVTLAVQTVAAAIPERLAHRIGGRADAARAALSLEARAVADDFEARVEREVIEGKPPTPTIFGHPATIALELEPGRVIIASDALKITDEGRIEVDPSRVLELINIEKARG